MSLMDAGNEGLESYLPLVKPRFQIRCIADTLERCEQIGRHAALTLDGIDGRMVVQQANGEAYLVHGVSVSGGPSAHRDTDGTWEYLLFAGALMGTSHVPLVP
jgi:hypothetical protein